MPSLRGDVNEVDKWELIKLQNNKQLLQNNKNTLLINREEILNTDDYNLSINRYKKEEKISSDFKAILLNDIIEFKQKSNRKAGDGLQNGLFPFYTSSQIQDKFINEADYKEECLIFETGGKATIHISNNFSCSSDNFIVKINNTNIIQKYIYYYLLNNISILENGFTGAGLKHLSKSYLQNISIPLPPLEIQEKIVKEIEEYEKIINGCREVVENWKPKFEIKEEWEKVELKDIAKIICGQSPESEFYNQNAEGLPFYQGKTEFSDLFIKKTKIYTTKITKEAIKNDILISVRAPVGSVNICNLDKICIGRGLASIRIIDNIVLNMYLFYLLKNIEHNIVGNSGAVFDSITKNQLETIQIPLPPLEEQEEIVAKIEEEKKCIESCKKMIEIYKEKIKKVIDGMVGGK